jgi:DNA-binding SARP family transcriptional activator/tetratricopeptide (TPR) repeat protein
VTETKNGVVAVPSPFHLSCLGEPQLFDGAGEAIRFRTRKHFALLIRLALEPGHAFSRDSLTELLWPDAPPKRARHSLAQGVSVLRAKLGRENLLVRTASVGLRAGVVETDVAHLATGTNGTIRGRFLDGFDVPGSRPFDDWKDQWTAQLIPKVRDALTRHMDAARRIADFATVERHAQLLHDLDTTSEEAVRGLMESRAWVGDRSNALKIFGRYESLLADELGAKPSADLVRMAHLLRDGRGTVSHPPEPGQPSVPAHRRFEPEMLIGREREFGALYDAWLDVRRRKPRIMVVLGDPGIGKTTLCNSFAASCQMEGAVVARVQAYDAERELPFAVVSELIRQLVTQRALAGADPDALSELSRIAPEISEAYPGVPKAVQWTPEVMSLRLADAFRKALVAASEDNPLIVVVDDLHAADASSTAILHVACRRLAGARLLMVFTARRAELQTTEGPAALVSDTYLKWLQTVEIEPLPAAAAEQLVRTYVAGSAERREPAPVSRILHAANGNPLALELVTREWLEHGAESLLRDLEALNTQPLPSLGIPRAIRTMFERLIQRLDTATRAALDLAAVLGRRLSDFSLYEAVDLHSGSAGEALSRLLEIGLLREVGGELEFKNELIRAQAYYAVAGPARQHLHRQVAATLAERPVEEGHAARLEIAWHYMRGGEAEKALPHALEGSKEALRVGAPAEAEEILSALLREPPTAAPLSTMRLLLCKALIDQSKAAPAIPVIDGLLSDSSVPPRQGAEASLMKAAATYLLNNDSGVLLCEVTTDALARARETGDIELMTRALYEFARSGLAAGERDRLDNAKRELQEILSRHAGRTPPMAYFAGAYCDFFSDEIPSATAKMEAAIGLLTTSGNPIDLARAYNGFGVCLRGLLRLKEAYEVSVKALELSRRVGDEGRASTFATNLCHLENLRGNYANAEELGILSIDLGTRAINQPELNNVYMNLADSYMLLSNRPRAFACLEEARRWMSVTGQRSWRAKVDFLLESTSMALMLGNTDHALELIGQVEALFGDRPRPVTDASMYEKFRVFRAGLTSGYQAASAIAEAGIDRYRDRHPYYFLNMLAAKAWVERTFLGTCSPETSEGLTMFDLVPGKRAMLTAQGFLA